MCPLPSSLPEYVWTALLRHDMPTNPDRRSRQPSKGQAGKEEFRVTIRNDAEAMTPPSLDSSVSGL